MEKTYDFQWVMMLMWCLWLAAGLKLLSFNHSQHRPLIRHECWTFTFPIIIVGQMSNNANHCGSLLLHKSTIAVVCPLLLVVTWSMLKIILTVTSTGPLYPIANSWYKRSRSHSNYVLRAALVGSGPLWTIIVCYPPLSTIALPWFSRIHIWWFVTATIGPY